MRLRCKLLDRRNRRRWYSPRLCSDRRYTIDRTRRDSANRTPLLWPALLMAHRPGWRRRRRVHWRKTTASRIAAPWWSDCSQIPSSLRENKNNSYSALRPFDQAAEAGPIFSAFAFAPRTTLPVLSSRALRFAGLRGRRPVPGRTLPRGLRPILERTSLRFVGLRGLRPILGLRPLRHPIRDSAHPAT
jgi:hypothetical protein